jgi:hypothetical protein
MVAKTFLCVSLVFLLLVFNPDCGLQGVKASPASKIFEKHLDSFKSENSEKTSVVGSRFSGAAKFEAEYGELLVTGEIYEQDDPHYVTWSVTHLDGWLVYSLTSTTTWFGGQGKVTFIDGGAGYDHWAIKWDVPRLVSAHIEITVVLYREVSKNFRLSYEHFHAIKRLHYGIRIYPAFQL